MSLSWYQKLRCKFDKDFAARKKFTHIGQTTFTWKWHDSDGTEMKVNKTTVATYHLYENPDGDRKCNINISDHRIRYYEAEGTAIYNKYIIPWLGGAPLPSGGGGGGGGGGEPLPKPEEKEDGDNVIHLDLEKVA